MEPGVELRDAEKAVRADRRLVRQWLASWTLPGLLQVSLSMWVATNVTFWSPIGLFWLVLVAATLCVVMSIAVLVRAFARDEAELGAVAVFFASVSILPLVHGITTPGVLVGDNTATMTSVLLAIPVGLIGAAPITLPRRLTGTWILRHWRGWTLTWMTVVSALAAALLIDMNLFAAPGPRSPLTVAVVAVSFIGCMLNSRRHLRIARVAGDALPLVVSFGYGLVGASAFVLLSTSPYSMGFWAAHAFDIAGVFTATIGALVVYRRTGSVRDVLQPVLVTDPLSALELGVDPTVHRFVADLELKDEITRDHVVRTAKLAIKVGEELRLDPCALRRVGLTAVLHDVGKLNVPDEILNKPGRLTDEEFEVVQAHAVDGEALVASSLVLAEIAPGVRSHHERIDGGGYPDGLKGDDIPRDARIVSVCDAFDAMSNTRQYREGKSLETVLEILRENSGSQWDPVVVAALEEVIRRDPPPLGSDGATSEFGRIGCDCVPAELIAAGTSSDAAG